MPSPSENDGIPAASAQASTKGWADFIQVWGREISKLSAVTEAKMFIVFGLEKMPATGPRGEARSFALRRMCLNGAPGLINPHVSRRASPHLPRPPSCPAAFISLRNGNEMRVSRRGGGRKRAGMRETPMEKMHRPTRACSPFSRRQAQGLKPAGTTLRVSHFSSAPLRSTSACRRIAGRRHRPSPRALRAMRYSRSTTAPKSSTVRPAASRVRNGAGIS